MRRIACTRILLGAAIIGFPIFGSGCAPHTDVFELHGRILQSDETPFRQARLIVSDRRLPDPTSDEVKLLSARCVTNSDGYYRATLPKIGGNRLIYTSRPPSPLNLICVYVLRQKGWNLQMFWIPPTDQTYIEYGHVSVRVPDIVVSDSDAGGGELKVTRTFYPCSRARIRGHSELPADQK